MNTKKIIYNRMGIFSGIKGLNFYLMSLADEFPLQKQNIKIIAENGKSLNALVLDLMHSRGSTFDCIVYELSPEYLVKYSSECQSLLYKV